MIPPTWDLPTAHLARPHLGGQVAAPYLSVGTPARSTPWPGVRYSPAHLSLEHRLAPHLGPGVRYSPRTPASPFPPPAHPCPFPPPAHLWAAAWARLLVTVLRMRRLRGARRMRLYISPHSRGNPQYNSGGHDVHTLCSRTQPRDLAVGHSALLLRSRPL